MHYRSPITLIISVLIYCLIVPLCAQAQVQLQGQSDDELRSLKEENAKLSNRVTELEKALSAAKDELELYEMYLNSAKRWMELTKTVARKRGNNLSDLLSTVPTSYLPLQLRVSCELKVLGAKLQYMHEYENWEDVKRYSYAGKKLPESLRIFGEDIASTIVSVSSSGSDNPSRIAQLCADLPHLRLLTIQDTPLRDSDLESIARLKELRGLYICGTLITDDAVKVLSSMESLRVLSIGENSLSEHGRRSLTEALPNLRVNFGDPFKDS